MFKALFSGKRVYANLMIFDNSKNKRIECVLIGACVLIRMNAVFTYVFQEGYAKHTGEWSRVYFMSFYIVMMVNVLKHYFEF